MKGKIVNIIGWMFLAVMVAFFAYACAYMTGAVKGETFRGGAGERYIMGYRLMYIETGSMEPELKTGSVVLSKKVENENDFDIGDIITFLAADQNGRVIRVTHRIESIDNETGYLTTKGDNNSVEDSYPVLKRDVESKVVLPMNWTVPVMKAIMWISSNAEYCFIIIPAFIVGWFLSKFTRKALGRDNKALETETAERE